MMPRTVFLLFQPRPLGAGLLRSGPLRAFTVLLWALLALGLGLGTLGCGRSGPGSVSGDVAPQSAGVPVRGGTLVVAFIGDLEGVNMVSTSSSQPTTEILERVFLKLLEELPDIREKPPQFTPQLAESWQWSDDHTVLTFNLRKDARWSDGVPITAEDVRWTWQAQIDEDIAWDNAVMKESITDVEVVDPHTVRFHFTHAYPGQLVHANEGVILPKHAWSEVPFGEWRTRGPWFQEHLVVSGPFTLESWKPQEEIVLKRNEAYFEPGLPYLDRVIVRVIPDASAQLTQFLGGSLDLIRQVPAAMADDVKANPRLKLITLWPLQFNAIQWNLENPLFEATPVRRALTLAIDRQTIIDAIWYGYAKASASPVVTDTWGHNHAIEPLPYDPEEARRLLASAGWKDMNGDGILDKGGRSFSFELLINAGNQERLDSALLIQQQLKAVGIEVKPRTLDWITIGERLTQHEFDSAIVGLSLETSLDLSAYFHSNSTESGLNFGSYSNPEVDRLLEASRSQLELEDVKPYLYRIQEILHQDQPQTLLWESQRLVGVSRRLQGAQPNAVSSLYNLQEWWVEPSS